jgi:hypothetical protein
MPQGPEVSKGQMQPSGGEEEARPEKERKKGLQRLPLKVARSQEPRPKLSMNKFNCENLMLPRTAGAVVCCALGPTPAAIYVLAAAAAVSLVSKEERKEAKVHSKSVLETPKGPTNLRRLNLDHFSCLLSLYATLTLLLPGTRLDYCRLILQLALHCAMLPPLFKPRSKYTCVKKNRALSVRSVSINFWNAKYKLLKSMFRKFLQKT